MKIKVEDLKKLVSCIEGGIIDPISMDGEKLAEPDSDGVNLYRMTVVYREFQPEKFGLVPFKKEEN